MGTNELRMMSIWLLILSTGQGATAEVLGAQKVPVAMGKQNKSILFKKESFFHQLPSQILAGYETRRKKAMSQETQRVVEKQKKGRPTPSYLLRYKIRM